MSFAVVLVTGPPGRLVYINGGNAPAGQTTKRYAVADGPNPFALTDRPNGPAVSRLANVVAPEPPSQADLPPV